MFLKVGILTLVVAVTSSLVFWYFKTKEYKPLFSFEEEMNTLEKPEEKEIYLLLFLAQNDALDSYVNNSINYGTEIDVLPSEIVEAFEWLHTPEGHKYWQDLYFKFKEK